MRKWECGMRNAEVGMQNVECGIEKGKLSDFYILEREPYLQCHSRS